MRLLFRRLRLLYRWPRIAELFERAKQMDEVLLGSKLTQDMRNAFKRGVTSLKMSCASCERCSPIAHGKRGGTMRQSVLFGIGVLARFLAMLAEHFAQWIFHQISEKAEAGMDLLGELWEFGESFVRMLADHLGGGRSSHRYQQEW